MTQEQLTKAYDLFGRVEAARGLLKDTQEQSIDVIIFKSEFGEKEVCTDMPTSEKIRTLLVQFHQESLTSLETEFSNL